MPNQVPTILVYGTPNDPRFLDEVIQQKGWGLVVDNGLARDVIFTIYENLARADAIVAFPDAHPVHLLTLLAEAEVGHPLIVQGEQLIGEKRSKERAHVNPKPIIFFGAEEEWRPFREQLQGMAEQGTLRDGFDRLVTYLSDPREASEYIESRLPERIPSTRLHYWVHSKKHSDISHCINPDSRPPSDITIASFGSASSKEPAHLERTDRAGKMYARNGWNILHGGGSGGVMGQLSETGQKTKAYVFGISVDQSGAPVIFFERDAEFSRPENIDHFVESKDMLHRIETYCGNSEAFVCLDGGIGSLQEVYVVAELLARQHPVVLYESQEGHKVPKPLYLLNESGIYTKVIEYLEQRGLEHLKNQIQVVHSIQELEYGLQKYFELHPPLPRDQRERHQFRERYHVVEHPMTELPPRPSAANLDVEPSREPSREEERQAGGERAV